MIRTRHLLVWNMNANHYMAASKFITWRETGIPAPRNIFLFEKSAGWVFVSCPSVLSRCLRGCEAIMRPGWGGSLNRRPAVTGAGSKWEVTIPSREPLVWSQIQDQFVYFFRPQVEGVLCSGGWRLSIVSSRRGLRDVTPTISWCCAVAAGPAICDFAKESSYKSCCCFCACVLLCKVSNPEWVLVLSLSLSLSHINFFIHWGQDIVKLVSEACESSRWFWLMGDVFSPPPPSYYIHW